ncbi:MAG: response regulator [Elusimicrobia bacterium]|nr:response regulator [Elusimicrobiota bacterium]
MPSKNIRFLVVDDEEEIRQGLASFLQETYGVTVETAPDGYQALTKIRAFPYDVVFLDISMPGVSGREVLLQIRQYLKEALVFVQTRWDSDIVAEEINSVGAEYIPKPYSLKFIRSKIDAKLKEKGLL